jgi:hypothetical protein
MAAIYRHTQLGPLLLLSTIPGSTALLFGAAVYDGALSAGLLTLAVVLGGVAYAFSSLTVEVTAEELTWRFGPGVFRGRVPRVDIIAATPVENPWWWGWGVHLTPRGWLYNISGLRAVEIALRDGTTFRLGSDDAAALARALASGR